MSGSFKLDNREDLRLVTANYLFYDVTAETVESTV